MDWRESLPARMALSAAGFLALLLLVLTLASYSVTALLIRQGMDRALLTALPLTANSLAEIQEHARKLEVEMLEHRHLRILDTDGKVLFGDPAAPVDTGAVARAVKDGQAFSARVVRGGKTELRTGPEWWQALVPGKEETRVLYAPWGRQVILEMAASSGTVREVLPLLLGWMLVLAAAGILLSTMRVWRMADAIYAPLRAVTAAASGISMATLSRRVPDRWHDRTLSRLCGVLNEMIASLEQSFAAQGRFVAAAAHELRGPIGAMRAQLEVRLRRDRSPEEYRQALEAALAETTRLGALAEHLLMLARYERGAALTVEPDLPLQPMLERAAQEVRASTGAEVLVEVTDAVTVDADPIALERAVANLIRNAVEAGGAPVEVAACLDSAYVVITVKDQGSGIPPEALPHLFEPFYRADPARSRERGAGLGLAIVQTVVTAHRGQVEVTSEVGKGTVVTMRIPKKR